MFDTPSAQTWFAGGERIGYDPKARAIVAGGDAPLRIFRRQEGNPAQAVSFLPGFPDGSFGWAKVRPYLPNADEMPKVFLDYIGMGDSDKPQDYAYSTAERTDLVEAIWRDLSVQSTTLVAFDFSSLVVLEHLRRRMERLQRANPPAGRTYAESSYSKGASSRTGTPTRGTRRPCCGASPSRPADAFLSRGSKERLE